MLLKFPGRVGEVNFDPVQYSATFEIDDEKAAIFGAGCWAQNRTGATGGMACSISGTGEEIVRANLARSIGATFQSCVEPHQILQRTLVEYLWSEPIYASINRTKYDFFFLSVVGKKQKKKWGRKSQLQGY